MSREIKLPRVWDTILKEMLYPVWRTDYIRGKKTSLYVYASKKKPPSHSSLSWVLHQPEFIVIWPIGRKDSSGAEIYEGDICRNGDWEEDAHAWNNRVEVVEWNSCNSAWLGWNATDRGCCCEIIGNIHQHPELMKEKE